MPAASSPSRLVTSDVSPPPCSMLWVDDDQPGTDTFARLLSTEGFVVDTATNGVQALLLGTSHSYALILLDLRLPDMSGIAVLRSLRDLRVLTPVVLVTGFATVAAAVEAMKLGALDVLEKPIGADDVVNLAKRVGLAPCDRREPPALDSESRRTCKRVAQLLAFRPGLSLEEIAQRLSLDRHTIERAVRAQAGRCFRESRRELEMQRAASIFRVSDLPVKVVAHDFGYAAPRGFSRAFTAVVGVSPDEYRKRRRGATPLDNGS